MIEVKKESINQFQDEIKAIRGKKNIRVNDIAIQMQIGASWASEMFSQLSTLQTGKFVELINAMGMKIYIDPCMNNHPSPDELSMDDKIFIELVVDQWKNNQIDGNQAMRKIINKFKLKVGTNE